MKGKKVKKLLVLFLLLLTTPALANPVVLYTSGGTETGTSANPIKVSVTGGAGTGTVNSGVVRALAYYPSAGTTVDDGANIYSTGTNIGIGTTAPTMPLTIAAGSNVVATSATVNDLLISSSYSNSADDSGANVRSIYTNPIWTGSKGLNTFAGFYTLTDINSTAGTFTHHLGVVGRARNQNTATVADSAGIYGTVDNSGAGSITIAHNLWAAGGTASAGTIGQYDGLTISNPAVSGSGAITNVAGVRMSQTTVGTNGNVGILFGSAPALSGAYAPLYIGTGQGTSTFKDEIDISKTSSTASGTTDLLNLSYIQSAATTGTVKDIAVLTQANATSGTIATLRGIESVVNNGNAATVTSMSGLYSQFKTANASAVVTSGYGLRIDDIANTGTITNTYGIHVGDMTTGTQTNPPYSLYLSDTNANSALFGKVGIGKSAPTLALDVTGTVKATAYQSSDGTVGVTVTSCTGFKNGLCISGT